MGIIAGLGAAVNHRVANPNNGQFSRQLDYSQWTILEHLFIKLDSVRNVGYALDLISDTSTEKEKDTIVSQIKYYLETKWKIRYESITGRTFFLDSLRVFLKSLYLAL